MSREEQHSFMCCWVKLTTKHILTECDTTSKQRNRDKLSDDDLYNILGPVLPSTGIFVFLQETGFDKLI